MSECIEWAGYTMPKPQNYGQKFKGGTMQYVHRLTWVEANGPVPTGMVVMHTCDNPPCYNLEHLKLGTQADNMQDMVDKGRTRWGSTPVTHCIHGHEYTEENTGSSGKYRRCRTCHREETRRRRA